MMSLLSSLISSITRPTSLKMSSISCLCCSKKARLAACRCSVNGRMFMSLIRFYYYIMLFLRALSKRNARESLLSPDYVFSFRITHTLTPSLSTDSKNYSLLYSLRLFLASLATAP